MGMFMNHFRAGLFRGKSFFCLQTPSCLYFQISHSMLLLREIKRNLQHPFPPPPFSVHQQFAKSSISLLIFFSIINSDACKLDNLLEGYCFSCFVHFVAHCFVYYLRLFFIVWVFTIGIYTLFCLRPTYFL